MEDAYVIDSKLNLYMTVLKSYGIQFSCSRPLIRLHDGVNSNPIVVSSRDKQTGEPLTVTVILATIKNMDGSSDPNFINSTEGSKFGIDSPVDANENDINPEIRFQPFKKVNIYKNSGGEYNIYLQFCDQCIIDKCKGLDNPTVSDVFDDYSVDCFQYSDIIEDYCKNYYRSNVDTLCKPSMYYIRFKASIRVPVVDGIKLYSLHGNKGVSSTENFNVRLKPIKKWIEQNNSDGMFDGLVVANNISMESRTMMGDLMDMKRNFGKIIKLETGETMLLGYVNYIVSNLMHPCQASRLVLYLDNNTNNTNNVSCLG